jgi:hypothetical protein
MKFMQRYRHYRWRFKIRRALALQQEPQRIALYTFRALLEDEWAFKKMALYGKLAVKYYREQGEGGSE